MGVIERKLTLSEGVNEHAHGSYLKGVKAKHGSY